MADFEKAKLKIDSLIFKLWRSDAIMFGALSILDKVADPNFDTCGIDSSHKDKISLRYNPNFINKVSNERLELILCIEGFRVLLRHPTTRLREPQNISHLASSLAINQILNDELDKILQGLDELSPDPKRFGLPDKQAYEEYYRGLLDKIDKTDQVIQEIWGNMSEEDKQKAIQEANDKAEKDQDKKDENTDSDNFTEFQNESEALKEYGNPNGNASQSWGKNNSFDADVKNFLQKNRNKQRMWGKYSGDVQADILATIDPKISCNDVIRKFGVSVISGKTVSSRMKYNRRFGDERPGYRRIYMPHVIFAVDVSGSMSDEDLAYGFGVINKLLYFAKITFVEFDTQITKIEKNVKKAKKEFHVHGRGGTDFGKIIDLSEELKSDGIIIYTDGYASAPRKPKCKVLWLMTGSDKKPPVDWGMRIHLDRFEDNKV